MSYGVQACVHGVQMVVRSNTHVQSQELNPNSTAQLSHSPYQLPLLTQHNNLTTKHFQH